MLIFEGVPGEFLQGGPLLVINVFFLHFLGIIAAVTHCKAIYSGYKPI